MQLELNPTFYLEEVSICQLEFLISLVYHVAQTDRTELIKITCSIFLSNEHNEGVVEFLKKFPMPKEALNCQSNLVPKNFPIVLIEECRKAVWTRRFK